MRQLNYHHLLCFWVVAREGGVSRAGARLRLAQPTISGQVRALEKTLGQKLFQRVGRRLQLTETGRFVYRYADQIFVIGRELEAAMSGHLPQRRLRFVVGVADDVPKLLVQRVVEPVLHLPEPILLTVLEDRNDRLLARLAVHELDLVISAFPLGSLVDVRAFDHPLGECGVTVFGSSTLAAKYRRGFPRSLKGAPMILPGDTTAMRRALELWFDAEDIHPQVVAEFDDTALLKTFGEAGFGLFAVPSVIEKEVRRQYGVHVVGRIEATRQRFFAISVERRIKHPAVLAITEAARRKVFL